MQRDANLEPVARAPYEVQTGNIMQLPVLQNSAYSASLDGVTLEGDMIVEIKCPGAGPRLRSLERGKGRLGCRTTMQPKCSPSQWLAALRWRI